MKEFNVGINTIVEFLKKHGFEVDGKPNAKLTESQYNLLQREFQKDIALKKQADEISIGSRKPKEEEAAPPPPVAEKPKEEAAPIPPAPPPAPVVERAPETAKVEPKSEEKPKAEEKTEAAGK